MKRRLLLSMMLIFVMSAICYEHAQEHTLAPPAKRKFKYDGKIETSYDQAKDQSMAFFKLMSIKELEEPKFANQVQFSDERLSLSVYFVYPGRDLITPHWVTIAFFSETENPKKYTDHVLAVKVDGQWVTLGAMKVLRTTTYTRRLKEPLVRQAMELPILYEKFLLLANAKKLKARLGSEEFALETEHLEAIRDLAAHSVP